MNRAEIVSHVHTALSAVLNREIVNFGPQLRLFEDLDVDSTSVIDLLMSLEDTIGLEVDPDELGPEVFQTVGSLTDYVEVQFEKAAAA
jgi:acyl carrier protein